MIRPKNKHESMLWDMLRNAKLSPHSSGHPDIVVEIEEHHLIACIEVKASDEYTLSTEQEEMMSLLHRYGWECYRWTPSSGLIPLFPDGKNVLLKLMKGSQTAPLLSLSPLLDWVDIAITT